MPHGLRNFKSDQTRVNYALAHYMEVYLHPAPGAEWWGNGSLLTLKIRSNLYAL